MGQPRLIRVCDPYIASAIANRETVLWLGPSFQTFAGGESISTSLQSILLRRWAAAFVDCPGLPTSRIIEDHPQFGDLTLRYLDTEAQVGLPEIGSQSTVCEAPTEQPAQLPALIHSARFAA